MATTFPLFQRLPTELRLQVWRETLPKRIQNPLYFYTKRCWEPRHLTEADSDYDPDAEHNINLEFCHEHLDPLEVEVPLFFVNHEAHSLALEWIRRQGLKLCFNQEKQSLVFLRPFHPESDTLYVSEEKWTEFHCDPVDRLFGVDLEDISVGSPAPAFTRLAVPDELLLNDPDAFSELFENYYGFDEIFIILRGQSNGYWYDIKDIQPQGWWELDTVDAQRPSLCWNLGTKSFQWTGYDGDIRDCPLYDVLQHASSELTSKLLYVGKERFEIRPVFVIRK
jgi:hypothetical protein